VHTPALCYFDNNATTRVLPEVVEAMLPFLTDRWGNPSSAYSFGHELNQHIDEARQEVANLIGAEPREIVFTSCGTESNNAAIHAALSAGEKRGVVITVVEHSANLKFCAQLAKRGYAVRQVPVAPTGALDMGALEEAIQPDTAVVSAMWANNETGVIFPVAEIAALCRQKGVIFHTDAVQAAGKIPIDAHAAGADMLSLSAHKLHAPKGIGALFVRRKLKFTPYLVGGAQENNRRGGTENVAGMVAFGRAAKLAREHLKEGSAGVRALRDRLEAGILAAVSGASLNGAPEPRLPNTTNIAFEGVEAEGVLMLLDQAGICASSGSACTTGSLDPSHVLTAMGLTAAQARGSIRLSLDRHTTSQEVDYVLECLPKIISRLRAHLTL
jgi:cysteine desulfurase